MSISIRIAKAEVKNEAPQDPLSQYPPPPPVSVYPSVDQDLFSWFQLYPHLIEGKFYPKDDKPLRIDIKKLVKDVPGEEIKPTVNEFGDPTGVTQHEESKLLRLGPQGRPIIYDRAPDFASKPLTSDIQSSVLRFREQGPDLELVRGIDLSLYVST